MEPITAGLIALGGAQALGGIFQGIGAARAGKKMRLTEAEERELRELERRQAAGELGLTERERGGLEQRFLAEQAGAQREMEAAALQQAAARGAAGAVSGREVFLQEMAEAQAERQVRQQQNLAVEEIDRAEREAERARIDAFRAQQKQAEAMRAQGIAQAVSLGLAGAGDVGSQYAGYQMEAELARIQAEAQAGTAEDAINQMDAPGGRSYTMRSR